MASDRLPATRSVAVAPGSLKDARHSANSGFGPTMAIAGGVVARTVILKLEEAWLPAAAVAEQVTLVAPRAKGVPAGGRHVTSTRPSMSSVPFGNPYVRTAPAGPVASIIMSSTGSI